MGLFAVRLITIFAAGACLGSLVNWAIYTLAWNPRPISPWSGAPNGVPRRRWSDRVPVLGWFALSREAGVHGARFWIRPLVLEIATGVALAALYWWEVEKLGLIRGQLGAVPIAPPLTVLHFQFASHAVLFL